MLQVFTIAIGIFATIVELFYHPLGWIILLVPSAFLLLTVLAVKNKKHAYVEELSDIANGLLARHWNFYYMPFAGTDSSSSASTIMVFAWVMTVISVYYYSWLWLICAWISTVFANMVGKELNPSAWINDGSYNYGKDTDLIRLAHNEVIEWMQAKRDNTQKVVEPNDAEHG
jgi:hypothetical protein